MGQYIYIGQFLLQQAECKIGITNNLERRLKDYNSTTGVGQSNHYSYLFTCQVSDMQTLENAIKDEFRRFRQHKSREIYFYNSDLFNDYVKFIKASPLFIKEILIKNVSNTLQVKIVKKTTPSLAERGLSRIDIINKAAKAKNDEFYTRYEDIEKELKMYDKGIWLDKTVFCNCDDAVDNDERRTSAFALYFLKNFKQLGLKKLICTHYSDIAGQGYYVDLFNQGSRGYIFTKDGFKELDYYIKCKEKPEGYNGSFDHPLSIKILNEKADIVVTNPPFSRAKDYWKLVIDSGKKFLILSNVDEPISNSSIHYFKNGQVWAGFHEVDEFLTPKHEITRAAAFWYTNLPIDTRPRYELLKFMPLDKIPEKYKRFDDEGMLLLDYSYIASDYDKPIAVSKSPILNGLLEKGYCIIDDKEYYKTTKGKLNYKRVLVQKI